ncbi:MAG: GGDEF domain-containing protein [Candidatus Edwardsbacteria bacterium]|nr:GGDEF domain-containing protein [Candidatus Edwardsbacteria bacterium]
MTRTFAFLGRRSREGIVAIGLALSLLIELLDLLTGTEVVFTTFYLLPIVLVAWYAGTPWGLVISALSAGLPLLADLYAPGAFGHPLIPYWNAAARFAEFVVVNYALAALRRMMTREQQLARQDPLTGIANTRAFRELLDGEIDRARRYGRPLSLAYIDLDDFKSVNDRFGHGAGDELLKVAAALLGVGLRATDTVARIGGDEFAVLLPETGGTQAREVMARLQQRFCGVMRVHPTPVRISIGVAAFERPPESADEAIGTADGLMYGAKDAGKDTMAVQTLEAGKLNVVEYHRCPTS